MTGTSVSILGLIFLIGSIGAVKHPNIIGAKNATVKQFPFIVSLRSEYGGHFCAGSIISDRHIVTAAHCVQYKNVEGIKIHTSSSRTDKEGKVYHVVAKAVHPTYNRRDDADTSDDVAVLKLKERIDFNTYQKKINLASRDIEEYEVGYAVGWGRTSKSSWEASTFLQKLRLALVSSKKCQPHLNKAHIDEKQICGFRNVGKAVCHGDSGGPLIARGELVGIVSRGDTSNCASGVPDIFTNVFAHKEFIEKAVEEL